VRPGRGVLADVALGALYHCSLSCAFPGYLESRSPDPMTRRRLTRFAVPDDGRMDPHNDTESAFKRASRLAEQYPDRPAVLWRAAR
jgi:hypothetical protein